MEKTRVAFPRSLDVVVWLNLAAAILSLVNGVMALFTDNQANGAVQLASSAVSFLIVIGILKRLKAVRLLVLILAWIGAIFYGIFFVSAILASGTVAILAAISFATDAVTIWGLMNSSSRRYFEAF
jgi:hypothetical protein